MGHRIGCATALVCLTLVHFARAEPPEAAPARRNGAGGAVLPSTMAAGRPADAQGYTYTFTDDPLAAGGFGANDARIVVAGRPIRTTLIRPRTSFVAEMLKTVENL